jgi:DNA-binding SARP family transcriptional activator
MTNISPPGCLYLFGAFEWRLGAYPGAEPFALRAKPLVRLFTHLLLAPRRTLARDLLAEHLWPDAPPDRARRNLREYLYRARRCLAEAVPAWADLLVVEEEQIRLDLPTDWWVDVDAFQARLAAAQETSDPTRQIALLQEARGLYRGDLLGEIYDDWVEPRRTALRAAYLQAMEQLAGLLHAAGEGHAAVQVLEEALAVDPLDEQVNRRLLEILHLQGERARALAHYRAFADRMAQELHASPTPEIQALAAWIEQAPQPLTGALPEVDLSGFAPPFVGRQTELARLSLFLRDRPQAPVDTVIVTGETGAGKTRLVREWLAALSPDVQVLQAAGHEFEQTIPYSPILDMLRQGLPWVDWASLPPATTRTWLAPLAQLLPDLSYYIPDLLPGAGQVDHETSHPILEGLAQLLLAIVNRRPTVLFLDDLHWADMPTWSFLSYASRYLRGLPVLLVATFSLSEAGDEARHRLHTLTRRPNVRTMNLSMLWPDDLEAMLLPELRKAVVDPGRFSHRLHQITNGNPFFVTEILRALLESDLPRPYTAASLDRLRLPDAVQTLIQTRLDRLSQESRYALAVASALRRGFHPRLVAAAADLPEPTVWTYVEDWLRRGLVVERAQGDYLFHHEQIRQVAYAGLSKPRREYIHRRIALALEQAPRPDLERISYHYGLSDHPERAIPGLLHAGQRALNARSYREAELVGQRLLAILRQVPHAITAENRLDLTLQLALAHTFQGETAQALTLLEEAARLAEKEERPHAAAEAMLRIAQIHWLRGDARRARPYAERCLERLIAIPAYRDGPLYPAVLRLLGRINISQGRFAEAVPYLEEALERLGDDPSHGLNRVTTLGYLMTAYARVGNEAGVDRVLAEVEVRLRDLDSPALHAVLRAQAAVAANTLGRWDQAETFAREALEACEEQGLPVYAFVARAVLGRVTYYRGRVAEAYRLLRRAIAWAERHDYWLFRFMAYIHLAEIAAQEGDAATLEEQIQALRELSIRTGNEWAYNWVLGYRSLLPTAVDAATPSR